MQMRRYWTLVVFVMVFFLATFLLVEALDPAVLTDPSGLMGTRSVGAAMLGVGLLVADVVLPVPSSLVMIAHGALFGVALGTLLSLLGSLGAAATGFFIGRRSERLMARVVLPEEQERANRMLARWGWLAIIVTRPVPILAETTAIMAGASEMRWGEMLAATLAGSLPGALLYAVTGATAVSLDNVVLSFGLVLLMAGLFWLLTRRLRVAIVRDKP